MIAAGNRPQPYRFERGFHVGGGQASAPPPPPPTYTAADLARERAAALAEGRAAALAEAAAATEARLAAAMEAVAEATASALATLDAHRATAIADGVAIAAAISGKLLPALYRREGRSEIEDLVAALLPKLIAVPAVVIRVNPADLADLTAPLAAIAERHGFAGRLTLVGDAEVASGDCRIDWGDGGAERTGEALWREIEALLVAEAPCFAALAPAARLRLAAPAASEANGQHANDGGTDG